MKTARFILYAIITCIIFLYGVAWIVRSEYKVEKKIEIQADYATVFPMISSLKEIRKWSSWHDPDAEMEEWYEGEDGKAGATYRWKGNQDIGEGEVEILSVRPDRIELEYRFKKPSKASRKSWIDIDTRDAEKVEISWGMSGRIPRPINLILLISDFEKTPDQNYEKGLQKLKHLAESKFADKHPFKQIQVQDVSFEKRFFVHKSIECTLENLIEEAIKTGKELESLMEKKRVTPYGNLVVSIASQKNQILQINVGFPLENRIALPGYKTDVLPEGNYYFIPINTAEYSAVLIPQIIENKLNINIQNQRIMIDFLEYAALRDAGQGLIGIFVLK